MSVLDDIRLYMLARKLFAETRTEALTMTGTKPGWKTTQFYLTLMLNLISILGVIQGMVPPADVKYIVMALTVLNTGYSMMRTYIYGPSAVATTTIAGPATTTTTTTKP